MLTDHDLYPWVRDLPIIDWHNHLDLKMLAEDKPLGSLYEVWVKADPYKHRAMRICGEPEELIGERTGVCVPREDGERTLLSVQERTGVCVPREEDRWSAWMRTLPKLVGNPIFAWAKMELEFLGLDPEPYLHGCGENVSLANWTPLKLLRAFKVEIVSPCVEAGERTLLSVQVGTHMSVCSPEVAQTHRSVCSPEVAQTHRSVRSPEVAQTHRSVRSPEVGERTLLSVQGGSPLSAAERTGVCVLRAGTSQPFREFPTAMANPSGHFCPMLAGGEGHARNLPHIAHDDALVFLTFRLTDSLPAHKLRQFAELKDAWLRKHPRPWTDELADEYDREFGEKIDCWLDSGHGSCLLRDPGNRQAVISAIEKFNETGGGNGRYVLHSYVVMPNHVHVLFELKDRTALASVVKGWKGVSARRINQLRGASEKVWQSEYFDRLIRNAEHYRRTVDYIRMNANSIPECGGDGRTDTPVRSGWDANAQECAFSGGDANAQECAFSVVPSLRMNAGDVIAPEDLERFDAAGCRVVDVSVDDTAKLETEFDSLAVIAGFAAAHGWTMLLHLGALRETSARLRVVAGPAGGFAGMRAPADPAHVARFLNRLEAGTGGDRRTDTPVRSGWDANAQECAFSGGDANAQECAFSALPRTILLSLNPEAHAQLAVLAGSFNGAGVPGKVQLGPAWWWCDHEEGIRDVLEKNAAYGVLSTFVGMTTDSRSLLSFVRHDYFRRILCRWTAEKIASGAFPDDEALIRPMLENICYRNAKEMIR